MNAAQLQRNALQSALQWNGSQAQSSGFVFRFAHHDKGVLVESRSRFSDIAGWKKAGVFPGLQSLDQDLLHQHWIQTLGAGCVARFLVLESLVQAYMAQHVRNDDHAEVLFRPGRSSILRLSLRHQRAQHSVPDLFEVVQNTQYFDPITGKFWTPETFEVEVGTLSRHQSLDARAFMDAHQHQYSKDLQQWIESF